MTAANKADRIHAACPSCGRKYSVPSNTAGKRFACKECGTLIRVAARAAAPAKEPVVLDCILIDEEQPSQPQELDCILLDEDEQAVPANRSVSRKQEASKAPAFDFDCGLLGQIERIAPTSAVATDPNAQRQTAAADKSRCRACGAALPGNAVICCQCGLNQQTGRRLKTKEVKVREDSRFAAWIGDHYTYIVTLAGGIGFIAGILFDILILTLAWNAPSPQPGEPAHYHGGVVRGVIGLIYMPVIGWAFGVAAGCAFAPQVFFRRPRAQQWLAFIGTQNTIVARLVCMALVAILIALIVLGNWLFSIPQHPR